MTVISSASPVNEEFKRPALYKIRRKPLIDYLKGLGFKFSNPPPLTELQHLVISKNIDISPLTGEAKTLGEPADQTAEMAMMLEQMAALQEENRRLAHSKEEKTEPKTESFSDLSLFQLRKVCKDKGIAYAKTDKKTDLLGKLEG